jgi:hypothetical protein
VLAFERVLASESVLALERVLALESVLALERVLGFELPPVPWTPGLRWPRATGKDVRHASTPSS